MADAAAPVVFKRKRGIIRKPTKLDVAEASTSVRLSDSDGEGSGSAVIVKKKRSAQNPQLQSTGSIYRNYRHDDVDTDTTSAPDDLHTEYATMKGVDSQHRNREDATRHSNWDLEGVPPEKADHRANDDGVYRGAKGYASFMPTRDDGSSSKLKSRGPIKQQTTVRSVTLMDYQPDVCKDYKETGYCGFGDTCKFLHDRSDYLAGWQLDALPNSSKRREDVLSEPEGADSSEEEAIPFACLICRQPFTDPVVTRCNHYFCAPCAIKRYAKTPKCFACGAQTGGLFNSATKIINKMHSAKQRREDARTEKRAQHGLDDDDKVPQNGLLLDGVEIDGDSE